MKTLTIGDTVYNLAYLISVKYKAKTREATPRRAKKTDEAEAAVPAGTLKSASSLSLHFLDCDTIHLKKDKADAVWSKLSHLLNIEPDDSIPSADESHPS